MNKNKLLLYPFVFSLFYHQPSWPYDTAYLIKEVELLRDSLKPEDPKKIDLTLKLADLYFDSSIQEISDKQDSKNNAKAENKALENLNLVQAHRLKALELYESSLKNVSDEQKIKLEFQIARLLTRLDEGKKAQSKYHLIINSPYSPDKMKEQSALQLAEWYEDQTQYPLAFSYYDKTLDFCKDISQCHYPLYRKAWLYYKDGKLDDAINTIEKTLWAKEGDLKENSLNDYILFLSNKETDGQNELSIIKDIIKKSGKQELLKQLAEAFNIAGNRKASNLVFIYINQINPNIFLEVRLLEEFYGFRNWQEVEKYLTSLEEKTNKTFSLAPLELAETKNILSRFIIQVDAERQTLNSLAPILKRSIGIYLSLFPNDELRQKMQEGWLTAEGNDEQKLIKIKQWIDYEDKNTKGQNLLFLRKSRLALAQKLKLSPIVIEEASELLKLVTSTDEKEEISYFLAREYYEVKNYQRALGILVSLIQSVEGKQHISTWAIQSLHITLDIYNIQKNYDALISLVDRWHNLTRSAIKTADIEKEIVVINKIKNEALFEKAVLNSDKKESIDTFFQFCANGPLKEQSCANAKELALKFKNQSKLIEILKITQEYDILASEYESMGLYKESADVLRKTKLTTHGSNFLTESLKISFLYELDQSDSRISILQSMIDYIKSQRIGIPKDLEPEIIQALFHAKMLDPKILSLGWSPMGKIKIAELIEENSPNTETQKILLSQIILPPSQQGLVWTKTIIGHLESEAKKIRKMKFYGAQSMALFKKKADAIAAFSKKTNNILNESDHELRIYALDLLKNVYKEMSQEILNTPIPEGLDEKTLNMVSSQIAQMADPFDMAWENYTKLLNEQLNLISSNELKTAVQSNLKQKQKDAQYSYANIYSDKIKKSASAQTVKPLNQNILNELKKSLSENPDSLEILRNFKENYTEIGNLRYATYFQGRIDELGGVK